MATSLNHDNESYLPRHRQVIYLPADRLSASVFSTWLDDSFSVGRPQFASIIVPFSHPTCLYNKPCSGLQQGVSPSYLWSSYFAFYFRRIRLDNLPVSASPFVLHDPVSLDGKL